MQDRYVGDIGDYGKLGLLRSLAAAGLRIGVNWYRTPDENHNEDGKFTQYLRTSGEGSYRAHDPLLWDALAEIVNNGRRQVESLEAPSILDVVFFHDILDFGQVSCRERENVRADWHQRALERLRDCDIVFADPDNGLMVPSALRGKKGNKYVLPEELFAYYQQGASVIYYQHKARRQNSFYTDQHDKLLQDERIKGAEGLGLKFTRTSLRYYWFLLHHEHAETVRRCVDSMLAGSWRDCFQLC